MLEMLNGIQDGQMSYQSGFLWIMKKYKILRGALCKNTTIE